MHRAQHTKGKRGGFGNWEQNGESNKMTWNKQPPKKKWIEIYYREFTYTLQNELTSRQSITDLI